MYYFHKLYLFVDMANFFLEITRDVYLIKDLEEFIIKYYIIQVQSYKKNARKFSVLNL